MVKKKIEILEFKAYFEKKVTSFGNGAKIDCLKKNLGKKAIVIIDDES